MNILYHHRTLADGAEGIHIHGMVDAFRALGHRVTVRAIARPRASGYGDSGPIATVRRRLPQAVFEAAAAALNVPEYLDVRRQLRILTADLLYKRHALIDVGALIAAKRSGLPSVLEVNLAYSARAVRQFESVRMPALVRRAERAALRAATIVLAVSTPLADYLRELAGPDLHVLVVPNGADPELFDPARADGGAVRARYRLNGKFVVGWAGLLRRWHGIELLFDAVGQTTAHLLLIGDGPDRRLVEQLADERGLSGRLSITGRVPHDAMPAHLAAVDVAVAAGDHTGFASPMKIVEYMAMSRPILLPRLRNFEDLVEHDRTGVFFRPNDPSDLARRIQMLEASPAMRDRLGRSARVEVERRLNWRQNARRVTDAVESELQRVRRLPDRATVPSK